MLGDRLPARMSDISCQQGMCAARVQAMALARAPFKRRKLLPVGRRGKVLRGEPTGWPAEGHNRVHGRSSRSTTSAIAAAARIVFRFTPFKGHNRVL